jgi:acyl dehydratase
MMDVTWTLFRTVRDSLKMYGERNLLQETSIGGSMEEEMYFEDFYPGQKFNSLRNYRVTAREIISFGESYDPQPFHIDEGAGENSFFSGLCASGWLTAAIVMRLRVESIKVKGPGFVSFAPARPCSTSVT